jgi:hypothetical protein
MTLQHLKELAEHYIKLEAKGGSFDPKVILSLLNVVEAAKGINEIGKRDMSNPKYDAYFLELAEALAALQTSEFR